MPILTDKDIISWAIRGGIRPFWLSHVNAASIDLCTGNQWLDLETNKITKSEIFIIYPRTLQTDIYNMLADHFHFQRKCVALLATTHEYITLPDDMAAEVKLKTTPSRKGLGHPIADWVDPGFYGELTLMLHAIRPIILKYGQPICQLVLHKLDKSVAVSYKERGHYAGQVGPTRAWDTT